MKRYKSLYLLLLFLLSLGYAWLIYIIREGAMGSTRICLFHNITGYPCPSCGTTRSVLHILRGDVFQAILTNPFGVIVFSAMIVIPIWMIYDLITQKWTFVVMYQKMEVMVRRPKLAIVLVALVIINWIWNIYKDL